PTAAAGGLRLWLSAASRQGQADHPGLEETPQKRRQEQAWQGSRPGGDVHAQAGCGGQAARPLEQEGVGLVRGPQGSGVVGAGRATKRGFGPDTTKTVQ